MNKLFPIVLVLMCFGLLLSLEEVIEHHPNGMPKVVKIYTGSNKLELTKQIGYYSNGVKKYQKTYYKGEIKNSQSWDSFGNIEKQQKKYVETPKVETFEDKISKIIDIRNWYVGYIWNDGINDVKWWVQYGTNSIGEDLDIIFCIESLNKEISRNLNSYNRYINDLDGNFSDLQYSWDKMYDKILVIQELINSGAPSITDSLLLESSKLRQYFQSFDREIEELKK